MILIKGQALGNDYLVLHEGPPLEAGTVRLLCDRHRGVGADGMLEPIERPGGAWGVRIWNPDGSLAEKSGNGLRIFARYLVLHRGAGGSIAIETASGIVQCDVGASEISVDMGAATFAPAEIPCTAPLRDAPVAIGEDILRVTAVGLGNPHCVSFHGAPLDTLPWRAWGAWLERFPFFPNRTNVQFARVVDRGRIEARVWERGAGETSASGSSACAVASVALLLGLADRRVTIAMPGGDLLVETRDDGHVVLTGPAQEVARIEPSGELLRAIS
jgi:diaminopimelate epimerase